MGPIYLADQTTPNEIDDDLDPWAALGVLLVAVLARHLDIDPEEHLPEDYDRAAMREEWGLTTIYDGTVNNDGDERMPENGS